MDKYGTAPLHGGSAKVGCENLSIPLVYTYRHACRFQVIETKQRKLAWSVVCRMTFTIKVIPWPKQWLRKKV